MYSEEDLKHLFHVFQKDANDARAEARKYRRKFELCREECKKWKTKYLEAKKLLDTSTIEEEEWSGGEIGTCSKCGHEGCASDIWNGVYERYYCPKCGRRITKGIFKRIFHIKEEENNVENR